MDAVSNYSQTPRFEHARLSGEDHSTRFSDDLAPARGLCRGMLLGSIGWAAIIVAYWLI